MKIEKINKPLNLTNNGKLELVVIGSGTTFSNELFNSNFILIKGDTHILVDFGITGPNALQTVAGIDISQINAFLPTHSHSDHIGGVENLALVKRYLVNRAEKDNQLDLLIVKDYEKILWDMSLSGGLKWNEVKDKGDSLILSDYFRIVNPEKFSTSGRDLWELNYRGIKIQFFRTLHIPSNVSNNNTSFISYGIFIDDKVFISGDTKFDRSLIEFFADKAEVMFHDCSLVPNPVHASIQELRKLPDDIKSKIFLYHYDDDWQEADDSSFAGFARQGYKYIFD